ncbi:hypothetical protein M153_3120003206 [Pseudoloma neurophilia]|uniref:Uncharacterized protein n=1 Tax=Pseudoloma neurophilia TaxID=146866 RepID=A0A0R0LYC1_9MICR|nr:hypothetical protein M153_3120003206 [Pseudoloma neurophilia]
MSEHQQNKIINHNISRDESKLLNTMNIFLIYLSGSNIKPDQVKLNSVGRNEIEESDNMRLKKLNKKGTINLEERFLNEKFREPKSKLYLLDNLDLNVFKFVKNVRI